MECLNLYGIMDFKYVRLKCNYGTTCHMRSNVAVDVVNPRTLHWIKTFRGCRNVTRTFRAWMFHEGTGKRLRVWSRGPDRFDEKKSDVKNLMQGYLSVVKFVIFLIRHLQHHWIICYHNCDYYFTCYYDHACGYSYTGNYCYTCYFCYTCYYCYTCYNCYTCAYYQLLLSHMLLPLHP